MLLSNKIQDMSIEELFGIIKPFLYLLPLIFVIIMAVIVVKIYKSFAVKRMLNYMDAKGYSEIDKRTYLTNYLLRASWHDLTYHKRNCPVCNKKYSLKIQTENERGDLVEKWNTDGCPYCKTKVKLSGEVNHYKYFEITRTKTNSNKEKEYQKVYEKLADYISFYKPCVDCSPDSNDSIKVDIYLH